MADEPPPRRRYQFSMRQLFAVVGWTAVASAGVRLCLIVDTAFLLPASLIVAMAVVAIIGTLGFRMGCWTPVVVLLLFLVFAIILAFARGMPTR